METQRKAETDKSWCTLTIASRRLCVRGPAQQVGRELCPAVLSRDVEWRAPTIVASVDVGLAISQKEAGETDVPGCCTEMQARAAALGQT